MNYVEFANVHMKFGVKNLLDFLDTIVIPAIKNTDFSRSVSQGRTKYFFIDVKADYVLNSNENGVEYYVPLIRGRFVKDTVLERQQYFTPSEGIVESKTSIESSPTAYFVLRLEDHRLLFYPETPHAPSISEFSATLLRALKQQHDTVIQSEQRRMARLGVRVSTKSLKLDMVPPELKIIKLPNAIQLSEAINTFKVLKRIEIEIVHTNDENTLNDSLVPLFKRNESLSKSGDATTKLVTTSPNGLDIAFAALELSQLAPEANAEIKLNGLGAANEKIELKSDEMGLKYPMVSNLADDLEKTKAMLRRFVESISDGVVQAAANSSDVLNKIRQKLGPPPQ